MTHFRYQQVYDDLVERINNGDYPPGSLLPSEKELARVYQLNFHTIRKALALLKNEGLIERRVGAGSFVLGPGARRQQSKREEPLGSGLAMLIQPDTGMFTMNLIEQLHLAAERKGLFLNIRPVKRFDHAALRAVEQLARQGCLAVLIPRFESLDTADLFQFVQKSKLPVILPEVIPGLEKNCCYQADYSGEIDYRMTELAFNYFKQLGFKNIAFFGPDRQHDMPLQRRLTSYSRIISKFGFQAFTGLADDSFDAVDNIVYQWAQLREPIAVICYDDANAIRLMTAIHKNALQIPGNIAVLGANNSPECQSCDPPLSSIDFPFEDVAGTMVDHALAMINGSNRQAPPAGAGQVVIRKSCGGREIQKAEQEKILNKLKNRNPGSG